MIIAKVYTNKANGQKLITIPKNCRILDGDYVQIKLIPDETLGDDLE